MSYVEEIRMAGLNIPEGSTGRIVCPFCKGGRLREHTCVVTRAGRELRYKCHRASCGRAGRVPTSGPIEVIKNRKEPPQVSAVPLPDDLAEFLVYRYSLEYETLDEEGVMYWPERDRVLLPVRSHDLRRVGWAARAVPQEYTGPKVLTIYQQEAEGGAFAKTCSDAEVCILVEDLFSAYAAAEFGLAAVALLGTHVTPGLEARLAKYSEILVALDADATGKAAGIVRNLSYLNVRQIVLSEDIKDMSVVTRSDLFKTL